MTRCKEIYTLEINCFFTEIEACPLCASSSLPFPSHLFSSHPFIYLLLPSFNFHSLPFPFIYLIFPSLPFPSLPFPSLPLPSLPFRLSRSFHPSRGLHIFLGHRWGPYMWRTEEMEGWKDGGKDGKEGRKKGRWIRMKIEKQNIGINEKYERKIQKGKKERREKKEREKTRMGETGFLRM